MTRMSALMILSLATLLPNTADAQVWQNGAWQYPNHASTAAEGYLNGASRLLAARGYYLDGLGNYLNKYEAARRTYIDNWSHYVRTRWAIQDQAKQRRNAGRTDWATRRMKELDNLERRHAVKEREQELRDKGILPPKKKSGFVVKGKFFESYEDFKGSDEWYAVKQEAQLRELDRQEEKRQAELRRQKAIEFGQMWRGMSWIAKERYNRMSAAERERYKLEWKHPELKYKRLETERNRKFYEERPYLIPRAKQPGSQLPPVPEGLEDALNRK